MVRLVKKARYIFENHPFRLNCTTAISPETDGKFASGIWKARLILSKIRVNTYLEFPVIQ